ncbi:class I SAM-dependent DNA methyltransferase [uncultured Jannaschia sp.]|uniref:type I restriction-modification system subunit M n=1 Tax=uncultured Jannaschia sp. TaxID=293347 RepID=UPI00261FAC54|nr:class I SAM-dependent DNA methyltransferase [uncultured Jannaschia sp.]
MSKDTIATHAAFIWSIAELLRGDFKQSEYGRMVLPFTILRRLDCLLEPTKAEVLSVAESLPDDIDEQSRIMILGDAAQAGGQVFNAGPFTFETLRNQDAGQLRANLVSYIAGFNPEVRDIFLEKFEMTDVLKRLDAADTLWSVFERFAAIDLHPDRVSNLEMGYLFEELIRRFSEISNETAGEHFTPREVVRLLVDLLLAPDEEALQGRGIIRRVYDPACGTGGMLSIAEEAMRTLNPDLNVDLFGQELNGESFAICKSDMLVKGQDASRIAFGNTLTQDQHEAETFHYMLSNPPYGVDWKKYAAEIKAERDEFGDEGRFAAGLPRVSDGQFLFLQHMLSKMRHDEKGSRIGIVMNGSPLFTGGAGSGESEIRRWLMEDDLVEAIIALPTDLFYNTGIQTYVWILTNRKATERHGKVQLIDASGERFWKGMRKSLGSKRREIGDEARAEIVRIYHDVLNGEAGYGDVSKVFRTTEFGYREVRVERPLRLRFEVTKAKADAFFEDDKVQAKVLKSLKAGQPRDCVDQALSRMTGQTWTSRDAFVSDLVAEMRTILGGTPSALVVKAVVESIGERDEEAEVCRGKDGDPEPDTGLRDHELVPLDQDWKDYVAREVMPFVPDAWVDESHRDAADGEVGRVGYEINFNRYFYRYVPPRPLNEIDTELKTLESEIAGLLKEVVA